MTQQQNFKLPSKANARVKKLWDDMLDLSGETQQVKLAYQAAVIALNQEFEVKFSDISTRMRELKRTGTKEICEIAGIEWSEANSYAVEASYLEFGDSYMSIRRPDPTVAPEMRALADMDITGKPN